MLPRLLFRNSEQEYLEILGSEPSLSVSFICRKRGGRVYGVRLSRAVELSWRDYTCVYTPLN